MDAPKYANLFAIFVRPEVVQIAFSHRFAQNTAETYAAGVVLSRPDACELRDMLVHMLGDAEPMKASVVVTPPPAQGLH